ncbi:uncharacterized protein with PQ loop repeat [Arthrobacter sp. PvP102]|jgi:uncharacterized protein with PQ loop repeat|uniref:hypothetical protein n=1 Tax=unclassified Arthrobacter TaxID=235627 RepID=UPI001AEA8273|nr:MULTISPECIES: hypothetical protein [unclassified Arthrobacter]MBP1232195.1 uncharacterized protein with PQ loop repeat [Arthrobacter sp. PvP103]MBP1237330.1 uncharacterized protein with PQ loop repeat [Arthrobacter sp. PvP102]
MNLPVLAGTCSTVLFALGMLPMLLKAARTKDLASYSLSSLVLSNVANAVHSVYVFHLPAGPIWLLHVVYVLASALMLVWWLRYRSESHGRDAGRPGTSRDGSSNQSAAAEQEAAQ